MLVALCDACEKHPTKQYDLDTGETQTDAAGGPSKAIFKSFDLCEDHRTLLLRYCLYRKDMSISPQIYAIKLIERWIDNRVTK